MDGRDKPGHDNYGGYGCSEASMTNPDPNARPPFRRHPYYYPVLKGVVLVCAAYFAARFLGYL
jgi:hypothetical protein